jgi:hypothetical protein
MATPHQKQEYLFSTKPSAGATTILTLVGTASIIALETATTVAEAELEVCLPSLASKEGEGSQGNELTLIIFSSFIVCRYPFLISLLLVTLYH